MKDAAQVVPYHLAPVKSDSRPGEFFYELEAKNVGVSPALDVTTVAHYFTKQDLESNTRVEGIKDESMGVPLYAGGPPLQNVTNKSWPFPTGGPYLFYQIKFSSANSDEPMENDLYIHFRPILGKDTFELGIPTKKEMALMRSLSGL